MDHFLNFYGLAIVGLIECFCVATFFGCKPLRKHIDEVSEIKVHKAWDVMIKYVAPLALLFLIVAESVQRYRGAYEDYPRWAEFLGGWLIIISLPLLGLLFQAIPWAEGKEPEVLPETFEEA